MTGRLLRPEEAEKLAAGTYETYVPWYGVTAGSVLGGAGGAALAKKLPSKYRLAGTLGGALLGTAAGLHGGEAVGRLLDKEEAQKTAEQRVQERNDQESRTKRVLKVMGKNVAGFGLGALTGAGIGLGGSALYRAATGRQIPLKYVAGIPAVAGAGMGLAYPIMKSYEKEELDRALKD